MTGTVATASIGGAQASFTLTLPFGSSFNTLTGATSVTIYQQAKTVMANGSSTASGSPVHVLGVMFLDSGQ